MKENRSWLRSFRDSISRDSISRIHHWLDSRPPRFGLLLGLGLVATAALAVQLVFLAVLPDHHRINENADYVTFYEPVANAMLAGEPWLTPEGRPAVRYPPGYPLFLAAVFGIADHLPGGRHFWLVFSNVLLAILGAVFHHLTARGWLSPSGALWASALWLSYLPFLWLSKQPNSEMPFLVALFATFWCFSAASERRSTVLALVSGGLLGLATLFRPVTLLLGLPLVLAWLFAWALERKPWVRDGRILMVIALLAGHVLVLTPWELWAHRQTGEWIPVSDGGRLSLLDGLTLAAKPERHGPEVPADVKALMEQIQEQRRIIRGPVDAVEFMLDHASGLTLAKMLWVQASRSWYATESLRFEKYLLLYQLPYLLLAVLGLWSLCRAEGRHRAAGLFILLVVLYFWAMTTLVLSILRYMVPAMALLMLAIAHRITFDLFPARRPEQAGRQDAGAPSGGFS